MTMILFIVWKYPFQWFAYGLLYPTMLKQQSNQITPSLSTKSSNSTHVLVIVILDVKTQGSQY
jgi:hypothetical protein